MQKLVTVCMPVYNGEKYLHDSLSSIARQTYKNIEIIIVNDGSTDQTLSVAQKLIQDFHLRGRVYSIENRGPEAARDFGLTHAKGDYLAPLDSDDLWEPEYLNTMISSLENYPKVGMAFSNFIIFDEIHDSEIPKSKTVGNIESVNHHRIDEHLCLFESEDFLAYALAYSVIFPSGSVYRRSFYNQIGPYTKSLNLYISCDWEFGLRALQQTDILYLKIPYLKKRKHQNNISGNVEQTAAADTQVLDFILDSYVLTQQERSIAIKRLVQRCFDLGYHYFVRNNHREARRWFLKCLQHRITSKPLFYICLTLLPTQITSTLISYRRRRVV